MIAAYLLLIQVSTPWLPNPAITPGEADPRLTDAVLRAPGFTTAKYRPPVSVTDKLKIQAMRAYGIAVTSENMRVVEGDHLVSLELAGQTSAKNIWSEWWHLKEPGTVIGPNEPAYIDLGAVVKDVCENATARACKAGKMSYADARKQIAADWTVLYRKLVSPTFPAYPFGKAHLQ